MQGSGSLSLEPVGNRQTAEAIRRSRLPCGPLPRLSARRMTGLSRFEMRSVRPATLVDYQERASAFVTWCRLNQVDWSGAESLDQALLAFLDHLFGMGKPAEHGSKLIASIKFFVPAVSRLGPHSLPRAVRAVKAWRTAVPLAQRLPLPRVVFVAVLAVLLDRRQTWEAVAILTQYRTYMRPGTCDGLKTRQLSRPEPGAGPQYHFWVFVLNPHEDRAPGKTGTYDSSIVWDSDLWMGHFFDLLKRARPHLGELWPVRGPAIIEAFMAAQDPLGLLPLGATRYSLRHGGASDNFFRGYRTPLGVKRRGGWAADSSLTRYGKEGWILAQLQHVRPEVPSFGAQAAQQFESLFLGRARLPPPAAPSAAPKGSRRRQRPAEL